MLVQSLGYVGLRAKDIEDWSGYGTRLLGLQAVDRSRATLALRMDDRKQRLIVNADGGEGIGFFGWEVADASALERLGAHLDSHGIESAHGAIGSNSSMAPRPRPTRSCPDATSPGSAPGHSGSATWSCMWRGSRR